MEHYTENCAAVQFGRKKNQKAEQFLNGQKLKVGGGQRQLGVFIPRFECAGTASS